MLVNEIIQNKEEFFKFLMYASQFYKADYYNYENILYKRNFWPFIHQTFIPYLL